MSETQSPQPLQTPQPLQLNGPVPDFIAPSTHGEIQLSTWEKDKWVVLFSHPADFTPVCTTEFMGFARLEEEFKKRNVALLGNSIDSMFMKNMLCNPIKLKKAALRLPSFVTRVYNFVAVYLFKIPLTQPKKSCCPLRNTALFGGGSEYSFNILAAVRG